ncbi:MAG: succinylglutamate desuccinylase/aspartoacylase family protein [Pseudomonadota bacterium]
MILLRVLGALGVFATLIYAAQTHAQNKQPQMQIGGLIGSIQIRSAIDVASLPRGRVHRFYLPAGRMPTGQDWLVPVVIIRGKTDGPKFLVTAAVHGDELNGIGVAHKLIDQITPDTLAGTLTVLPSVNIPGILAGTRNLPATDYTGAGVNLNRQMPGSAKARNAGSRYAHAIWRGALQGNADFAVDVHTQSTGTSYPMYVFADYRQTGVEEMATLLGPHMIKIDTGQKGTVETALNEVGVPTVTLEIGAANVFEYPLIHRAVAGIKRLMAARGMLPGYTPLPIETPPIIGNDTVAVEAVVPGIVIRSKFLLDAVNEGDEVAVSVDPFGRVIKRYTAPVSGTIAAVAVHPIRQEGGLIVRILTLNTRRSCRNGC